MFDAREKYWLHILIVEAVTNLSFFYPRRGTLQRRADGRGAACGRTEGAAFQALALDFAVFFLDLADFFLDFWTQGSHLQPTGFM